MYFYVHTIVETHDIDQNDEKRKKKQMNSLSSPENIFHWPAVYGAQHTTVEILIFRPTHFAYGSSYFPVFGEPIKDMSVLEGDEWRKHCAPSVLREAGGFLGKKKLSVCLGSGQIVVSKKSLSENTLDAREFRFSLYIWDFTRGWYIRTFFFVQFTLRSASQST